MQNLRTITLPLTIAFFALALSAQAQVLKRTTTKTERFDFAAGGTIAISGAPAGSIRIVGSSTNEVVITAEIELQAATEADLARLAEVTGFVTEESISRTGIITVGTHNKLGPKALWKKFPKELLKLPFRVDYVVTVPRYADLEISGGKGDLSISGVEGSMRINFLDTNATVEVIGGNVSATFGTGKVDLAFGTRGWRGRAADVHLATGELTIQLPSKLSAELDAVVQRSGSVANSLTDLKPRDRRVPFTEKSILAKAGVGGPPLRFTVGDGTLRLETLKM
jgi:hypothetical protein